MGARIRKKFHNNDRLNLQLVITSGRAFIISESMLRNPQNLFSNTPKVRIYYDFQLLFELRTYNGSYM